MKNHTNECDVVRTACTCDAQRGRDKALLAVIEEKLREAWMDGHQAGVKYARKEAEEACGGS